MSDKPRTVIHSTDDKPQFISLLMLATQIVVKCAIMVMFPLLVAEYAGASKEETTNFISISLIAGGLGTLVQAFIKPQIAAGQLLPTINSVPYFVASLSAAKMGGLSLVVGMTIVGGLIQLAMTPLIRRFRFFFTRDTAGFILVMLGFWLGALGVQEFFNPDELGQLALHSSLDMDNTPVSYKPGTEIIGFITLSVMVILRLWSPQKLRLYCILIATIIGWGLAFFNDFIPPAHLLRVSMASWVFFPKLMNIHYSFHLSLLATFALAALGTWFDFFALAFANQEDAHNKSSQPDYANIRRGNFWSSANSIFAGVLGTAAQTPLPGAVGINVATGVYSRTIGYIVSFMFFILAFSPKILSVFLTIPAAVNGATLVFIGAALFMEGVNMMNLQQADNRKTYALGISFLIAASTDIIPAIYNPLPELGIVATDMALLLGIFCFILLMTVFSFKSKTKK